MKKTTLATGHCYHLYNRGVEKRDIYLDEKDYFRFLLSLEEFNNSQRQLHLGHPLGEPSLTDDLVSVVCYCLMPNHFHLLVRQEQHGGISKWMQKVCTGYASYFNLRYQRTGRLFEGTFKARLVKNDSDLLNLSRYIHRNPKNIESYRWSSLQFYLDCSKASALNLDRKIILDQMGETGYKAYILGLERDSPLNTFLKIDEEG